MQLKSTVKSLFLAMIFLLTTIIAFSQTQKTITIVVSGTTYDNPELTSLKNYLKSSTDITALKTAFNSSTATLTFTSSKNTDDLWDDVPDDKKTGFNVVSIDNKTIKLSGAKSSKTSNSVTTKGDKTCGCDYFPLCNPDATKNFMGQSWKGFNNDGKVTYYHCSNGVLKAKYELFDNFEGNSLGFATYTALKYNEPKGAKWDETVDINGAKYYYSHVILKKGIQINVGEEKYNDAILVRRYVSAASMFYQGKPQNEMEIERKNIYYVKNVGAFSEREVKEIVDDLNNNNLKKTPTQTNSTSLLTRLVSGEWHCDSSAIDPKTKKKHYTSDVLVFNADGTYSSQTSIDGGVVVSLNGRWKITQNTVEIIPDFDENLVFEFAVDDIKPIGKLKHRYKNEVYQTYINKKM